MERLLLNLGRSGDLNRLSCFTLVMNLWTFEHPEVVVSHIFSTLSPFQSHDVKLKQSGLC